MGKTFAFKLENRVIFWCELIVKEVGYGKVLQQFS
jgi:hypothetical protein